MKFLISCATWLALLFSSFTMFGQGTYTLKGRVTDSKDKSALAGVTAALRSFADSTQRTGGISDDNGVFTIPGIKPGRYMLRLDYLGYRQIRQAITIADKDIDLGEMAMSQAANELKGVTVGGKQIRGEQKGDTSQFRADAFKTNPDATAEDLVNKMPGVTSDNTGVKVNGETVQNVMVDGKPFFGSDPSLALKNLPSEVVDKIQVFDRLSDQANFTGFDDGTSQKTMNIITRRNKSEGVFGKLYAGYGTDDRYIAGGNVNFFNGDRRISILGMSNNINQQNFSIQDILGATGSGGGNGGGGSRGGRGGGGNFGGGVANNFMVGQQNGISVTNSAGLNYSDTWGKKLKVSGSYFYNSTDNTNATTLTRNYFSSPDSTNIYNENSSSEATNFNHRVNLRLEYTIDSFNSIIFTPGISFQRSSSVSNTVATDSIAELLSSATTNRPVANSNGYNSSNNLLFQHKFKKARRTISFNMAATLNEKNGDGAYYSSTQYGSLTTLRDQQYKLYNNTYNLSPNVTYTEPVGKKGQLMFTYNPSFQNSNADKETYNKDTATQNYTTLDPVYSNKYSNTYNTQKGGLSYRVGDRKLTFNAGLNVQYATLSGEQEYPMPYSLDRNFTSVLPNAMLNIRNADGKNLRIMYRTNTNAPSITQLQNVVDISNPLLIKTGNTGLRQDYEQTFIVRYGLTNAKTARNFFLNLYVNYINNYIGNASYIPGRDSLFADPATNTSVVINRGSQLSRPVNLDGYFATRLFLTYGLPVKPLKSNLNLNGGLNYTCTPGMINTALNYANNFIPSFGIALTSNISEQIDFSLSYNGNYNIVQNTAQSQANNNYYNHLTSAKINYILFKKLVLNTSVTENYYTAFSSTANQNFYLWNAYVAYKFFKNNALEARITAFDILNQNKSISRTVTETYIENSVTQVLQQYFMLQLTYTIRKFKGAMPNMEPTPDKDKMDMPYPMRPMGDRPYNPNR